MPGFDVELGPGGLGFGDETLFAHQIVAAGFRTVRRLGVEVEHHFDPERLTRSSLLKLAEKMGRSGAYVEHHWLHYHRSTPRLKWVKHVIELGVRRACRLVRHGVRHQPPVSQWELDLCREIGTFAQARVEQNRPRRYERHGRHGLARLDPGT